VIDFPSPEERREEAMRLLEALPGQWVAERMSDGGYSVSKATVRLWRRGDRVPELEDLLRMPAATGRPLDPKLRARIFDGEPDELSRKEPPTTATG
jgi:hypothetical protein